MMWQRYRIELKVIRAPADHTLSVGTLFGGIYQSAAPEGSSFSELILSPFSDQLKKTRETFIYNETNLKKKKKEYSLLSASSCGIKIRDIKLRLFFRECDAMSNLKRRIL